MLDHLADSLGVRPFGHSTAGYKLSTGNKGPNLKAEIISDQELSNFLIYWKVCISILYSLDFTLVYLTKITTLGDCYSKFDEITTEIVSVLVDTIFSHLAWVQIDGKSGVSGIWNFHWLFLIDKEEVIQHAIVNNLYIDHSVDANL